MKKYQLRTKTDEILNRFPALCKRLEGAERTPETQGLVNTRRLAVLKSDAFLINTGRGPLVIEPDLADALNSDRIAGAALDVLSAEPPPSSNPLLTANNCLITPHIAWASKAARERLLAIVVENVRNFLAGQPTDAVNL